MADSTNGDVGTAAAEILRAALGELEQEQELGRLEHTAASGVRVYAKQDGADATVTYVQPNGTATRYVVAGVDLDSLR